MRNWLLTGLAALILFVSGCCAIRYETDEILLTYFRFGPQKLESAAIKTNPETGLEFYLGKQHADINLEELVKALTVLGLIVP